MPVLIGHVESGWSFSDLAREIDELLYGSLLLSKFGKCHSSKPIEKLIS